MNSFVPRILVRRILVILALAAGYHSSVQGGPPLPTLDIWHSRHCPPCLRLIADGRSDPEFVSKLRARYSVRWRDIDSEREAAILAEVHSIPQFITPQGRITGYLGKQWLLDRLALQTVPRSNPPEFSATSQPRSDVDIKLDALLTLTSTQHQSIERVSGQIPDWEAFQASLEASLRGTLDSRLSAMCDLSPALNAVALSERTLTGELYALEQRLGESRRYSSRDPPDTSTGTSGVSPAQGSRINGWLLSQLPSVVPLILGVAGVGVSGGLVGVALWTGKRLLQRIWNRRRSPPARETPERISPPDSPATLPAECPNCQKFLERIRVLEYQLAQRSPEVQFAPYETQVFQEAFTWAKRELGTKYPGSQSLLEAMDSLIAQYLSSHPPKTKQVKS